MLAKTLLACTSTYPLHQVHNFIRAVNIFLDKMVFAITQFIVQLCKSRPLCFVVSCEKIRLDGMQCLC